MVLATSRVALRVRGEREYRVAPLELPDASSSIEILARSPAVALFLDRSHAAGAALDLTAATAPAVAEICRRLDGLPLAVELAAAWTRLLPPPALLERLAYRLPMLVGGPHDLPARQRTMRDTIAWSYGLLDAEERRLFRSLCVFVGGCTPEAVAAVCTDGGDASTVLGGLAALVDRCLLRSRSEVQVAATEPRLIVLETLREYGLEQLDGPGGYPDEAETLRRRHARYFLALAEAADAGLGGPNGVAWAMRLEEELDNLRAALRWSLAHGQREVALRLAGALWRFWSERGHLSEGRHWLSEGLSLPSSDEEDDFAMRERALVGAARLAIDQGAYGEAEAPSLQAVALARERGAPADLVLALNTRGLLARERGDYPAAMRCHDEALMLAQGFDDQPGLAAALTGLGYAAMFAGDVARGSALLERSLAIFRAVGDARGLAAALIALAVETQHTGEFARSEAFAAEALELSRAVGDTGRMADALWVLGVATMF